jgi:hypothetical protein
MRSTPRGPALCQRPADILRFEGAQAIAVHFRLRCIYTARDAAADYVNAAAATQPCVEIALPHAASKFIV